MEETTSDFVTKTFRLWTKVQTCRWML